MNVKGIIIASADHLAFNYGNVGSIAADVLGDGGCVGYYPALDITLVAILQKRKKVILVQFKYSPGDN